jgi:acyl-[acyl-carrier-protein] desaturase
MSRYENKLSTEFHLPEIVKGPWTQVAKQKALDREVLGHYIEYFGRSMKQRNWSPWHNFPLKEMAEYGDRLSENTIDIIEGFLGVEEYVGDYVESSLQSLSDHRTRRNMQLQWGAEETKHGVSWELVLKHSGVRTDEQLEAYFDKVRQHSWSVDQHPGMDTPLGITAYAMVQERATYYNYQEMRRLIREDYGLSVEPTTEEKKRGYEVGASEAFRVVGIDEIAHHAIFLKIVQSHIKYFPSLTFEVLMTVFEGFEMPAWRYIPNRRQFIRGLLRTKLYTKDSHEVKIQNPVLKLLGLDGYDEFEKAVQLSRKLPVNLGPDDVKLSRAGEWVVSYAE